MLISLPQVKPPNSVQLGRNQNLEASKPFGVDIHLSNVMLARVSSGNIHKRYCTHMSFSLCHVPVHARLVFHYRVSKQEISYVMSKTPN